MFQEEIIFIYGLVMVFLNLANEWKVREGSCLTATIENLFALVKRNKIDESVKEGRGRIFLINSVTESAIKEAQLHIHTHFYAQMPFWCKQVLCLS